MGILDQDKYRAAGGRARPSPARVNWAARFPSQTLPSPSSPHTARKLDSRTVKAMDEQILVQILEQACKDSQLVFQVVEQEEQLHVFLNRRPEQVLNYRRLGKQIYTALDRLTLTGIRGVCLYSRILGSEEPDWEGKFRLSPEAQRRNRGVGGKAMATPGSAAMTPGPTPAQSAAPQAASAQPPAEELPLDATYVLSDAVEQRAQARQGRATMTRESTPPAEAAAYPLSDPAGATEAAADYEEATPTVSVVANPPTAERSPQPQGSPETTNSAPSHADFDLANYCFIRNHRLLTADLVPPSKAVAKQIDAFHHFDLNEQQQLLPQLERFFQGAPTFRADGLPEALQQWLRDTEALGHGEMRKASIWMSRYCADPEATLAVVARVFDPSLAAPIPAASQTQPEAGPEAKNTHASVPPLPDGAEVPEAGHTAVTRGPTSQVGRSRPRSAQRSPAAEPLPALRSQPKSPVPNWLFPSIVLLGSLLMMALGLVLAQPPQANAALCNGSSSLAQCQLAQQIIIKAETWADAQDEAMPLPSDGYDREMALSQAVAGCNPQAAINGGYDLIKAYNNEIEPLNSNSSEIMPGIVLADIEHQNDDGPGTVRTACVMANQPRGEQDWAEVLYLADAVIPADWPATPYDNSEDQAAVRRSAQATHPLVNFGSILLFTTVGLFVAAMLRMAVTAHSINALCQAAVVMAIFEAILDVIIPFGGILLFPVIIAKKSFALGLTGAVVPGFRVDWSQGYMSVAGCVVTLACIRFVLRWVMMLTILGGSSL